jgi:hypothetical protein
MMSVAQSSSKPAFRERAVSELKELVYITAYLFVVFSALTFYKSAILPLRGRCSPCLTFVIKIRYIATAANVLHRGHPHEPQSPVCSRARSALHSR